jgi:hypothetical protein
MLLIGKIGNTSSNKVIEIFHILNSLSSFLQLEHKVDEPSYQEDSNPSEPENHRNGTHGDSKYSLII